ncbi:MAG: antibiotic biosynthesis monooxygenase [bacterium]|nr:antibiotic biosynthesis monooxygenase [bacterium]
MYIAMNHFRVAAGRGSDFEDQWRRRESYLDQVPGFVQFHLVRGKDEEDGTHRYASHTTWNSRQAFLDWTHSEAFRKAHGNTGGTKSVVLQHPEFKGWEAVEL